MDLSLWDPPDDRDYVASQDHNGDHSLHDFCCGYGHDVIEEDALNEISCQQVLNILVSKADEEITEFKEDMMMIHCQLAWYNEALIEKTDHLNLLIQNLKNGNTEDVHHPDLQSKLPWEQPQSSDGCPKPSVEHSVKIKQEISEEIASKDNKNIEEKECCSKSQSMELEVDSVKQGSKSPGKVRKARSHEHANDIDNNVPSVEMKRKRSKSSKTGRKHSLTFKEGEEKQTRAVKMELEHETLHTNPAKPMERELESSTSTQNVNVQQPYRLVGISISKNGGKETQPPPIGENNVASTSTSSPEKVTEPIKCCRKLPVRLTKDHDTSSSNRPADGVGPGTNGLQKLTLVNLKAICKSLNMKGYTKHCKAELIKLIEEKAPHLL